MAKIDELVVNFAVYEDANEYLGMAEASLPDLEYMSEEMSGAGIGGNVEEIIIGHLSAMTATLNFRTVCKSAVRLLEPRVHKIDLRVAQQQTDNRTSGIEVISLKHIMRVKPKKTALGKVAAASTADVSGEYAVSYYAMYMNGKKITEVDPLNFICTINGKDYLEEVRRALGK